MNLSFSNTDQIYTHFVLAYDQMVKFMPNWQAWISSVLTHVQGPRVLDVSCGTGYLLNQLTNYPEFYGIDINAEMLAYARKNFFAQPPLQRADAHQLPYRTETFDTVINTMAFNGYQDNLCALSEMYRVLRVGGRLLIVDVNPPADHNPVGMAFVRKWETRLNLDLDMGQLFKQMGFSYVDHEIGGFGSVHLYLAAKETC